MRTITTMMMLSVFLAGCANTGSKAVTDEATGKLLNAAASKVSSAAKGGESAAAQSAADYAAQGQTQIMTATVAAAVERATTQVAEETGKKDVIDDPTLVPFEKMSAALTPVTIAQVRSLAPALVLAKKIVITGHCPSGEVGNAKAAALRRAEVVKKLLVDSGISAGKITLRTNTKTRSHSARIDFSG